MTTFSVLDGALPSGWRRQSLWTVAPRVSEKGYPDAEPLSVYLELGVVPRASREDNHNRLGADLSNYLRVRPGDVVFNKLRTWQGGLGVSSHDGIVSPAYFVCRPTSDVEPRYLHHLLRSAPYLAELARLSKWMPPSQFDIGWDQLRTLPIVLPSLVVQRQIADFLGEQVARMERVIELRERERQLLREQRDAEIRSIVSGDRYDQKGRTKLPWLDGLPTHWTTPKVTHVAQLGSGHTPSRSRPEWWINCDIPWITTGEVAALRDDNVEDITKTREKLSRLGIENSSAEIHPAGTVVLSRTASAGYSGVMATDMCTSQDFVTWTCTPRLNPYWLLWCLRAMRSDLLGRLAMGSTFKTIYVPDIQTLRIPLPPLGEQLEGVAEIRRIVQAAKRRTELIDQGIALLNERKQALVTAAVTGQVDVTTGRAVA